MLCKKNEMVKQLNLNIEINGVLSKKDPKPQANQPSNNDVSTSNNDPSTGFQFNRVDNLTVYKCSHFPKIYVLQSSLKDHLNVHKGKLICDLCNHHFARKLDLEHHLENRICIKKKEKRSKLRAIRETGDDKHRTRKGREKTIYEGKVCGRLFSSLGSHIVNMISVT